MTLSNLSQILHRNHSQRFYRKQPCPLQHASIIPCVQQSEMVRIYERLGGYISYVTGGIQQQIKQNQKTEGCNKCYVRGDPCLDTDDPCSERQFSFVDRLGQRGIKQGRSKFSTGVDSLGVDREIAQIVGPKINTQMQVNQQIFTDLMIIK